ncbi:MAG: hypothetical protein VR67_03575 [Peptococcaceae bacterium BRH_c8a]|nr:MAG: hypothetical protein VR67_10030 [Peptococcaceae bacterium BRH_c8a]KJS13596.1 MAG: hypothetical protein VR67_03575 [Peptococcaceae bacterium BRH_c8a]
MEEQGKESTVTDKVGIALKSRMVCYRETGSYSILPAETVKRVSAVNQKIGINTVDLINPLYTDGVPIYRVNNAFDRAKCHRALFLWSSPPTPLNNPVRENYGKGMTAEQSKASAMMEAVERFCGQRFSHQPLLRGEYEDVRNIAVNPFEFSFPTLPLKCLYCRARERMCFQDLSHVCREWTWGYSLVRNKPILVPAAMVFYPYMSAENISFIFNDTGGLAAGNTIEEALLQGIAEIIERDALYQTFNLEDPENMNVIDFSMAGSPHIQKFIREVLPAKSVFAFKVANNKLGTDISTYTAFTCYLDNKRRFFGGSGTSLDPEAGLLRALTEMEQQKVRQKVWRRFNPERMVQHGRARNGCMTCINDIPNQSASDIKTDLELYLSEFEKRRIEVIAVDLTHPDVGIPVVRVIIPKLISYSGSLIKEAILTHIMQSFYYNSG